MTDHATHTRSIPTQTHGRYLVEGPPGAPMLVGFHGYRENAPAHLAMLRRIAHGRDLLLVSVQGLHRFYNRDHTIVVANWMTAEDRTEAIADNIAYVASVVTAVRQEFASAAPLVFVGFSQGASMAYRAAVSTPCAGLVVLAGDVPPDIEPVAHTLPRTLRGYGSRDHWYTEAKAGKDLSVLQQAGVNVETFVFDGPHEWDRSFIERAAAFVAEVL